MLRLIILLLVFIYPWIGFAQNTISGKVVNKKTREVIVGATVYMDNTTIATSSNKSGEFALKTMEVASFNIVCSAVGYEVTTIQLGQPDDKDRHLLITLVPKVIAIEEVEVSAFLKDGWKIWGKRFTSSFIGSSTFAEHCMIENPEVIRFRYSEDDKVLHATASVPIKITNKDLGYTLYCDLKTYEMHTKTGNLYYDGYLRFESVGRPTGRMKAYRKAAYQSSFMRFIRSTFHQNWEKDGYVVKELFLDPNLDREQALKTLEDIEEIIRTDYAGNAKAYWNVVGPKGLLAKDRLMELVSQPKTNLIYGKRLAETDIISSRNHNRGLANVSYKSALQIENSKIKLDANYVKYDIKGNSNSRLIFTPVDAEVEINRLGEFKPIKNWSLDGYFAWFNKMSTILPLDYEVK
ncbi:CarboxypepD_reg-like domain-containing protein [Sphingobacterium nematocida]|uniref:CarboxypepD_reg-like domain-containing protein n=1 Tax=Sphingobacterium nematocida TaxID=1513896 RepID=A0A1T5DK20_9SPHI|nr:carboxypeptidase-like regulatory domain-containing protein [Sphingobacterium nematocida]SKB72072.1 CarboxypepD_reg-like domain-containing protein [Sphingobacterium nematocida]